MCKYLRVISIKDSIPLRESILAVLLVLYYYFTFHQKKKKIQEDSIETVWKNTVPTLVYWKLIYQEFFQKNKFYQ